MPLLCPNVNHDDWKKLVELTGSETAAYKEWLNNGEQIPDLRNYAATVTDIILNPSESDIATNISTYYTNKLLIEGFTPYSQKSIIDILSYHVYTQVLLAEDRTKTIKEVYDNLHKEFVIHRNHAKKSGDERLLVELDKILNNWDNLTKFSLADLAILGDIKIVDEYDADNILTMDTNDVMDIIRKDWLEDSRFKINPKDTLTKELKRFLQFTPNFKIVNDKVVPITYLGMPTFVGFKEVYDTCSKLLDPNNIGTTYPTPEVCLNKLRNSIEVYPWLDNLVKRLDYTTKVSNKASNQDRTAFYIAMARHTNHSTYGYRDANRAKFTVNKSNTTEAEDIILANWINTLKRSKYIIPHSENTGEHSISEEGIQVILSAFDTAKDNPSIENVDTFLKLIGIHLKSDALASVVSNGIKQGRATYTIQELFVDDSGLFKTFVDTHIIGRKENNFSLEEDNPFRHVRFRALANIAAKGAADIEATSFRNMDGEVVQTKVYGNYFIDNLFSLLNSNEYVDELLNCPFTKTSTWLEHITVNGKLADTTARKLFKYSYPDGMTIAFKNRDKRLKNMTPAENAMSRLGTFMSASNRVAGIREIIVSACTFADNHTVINLNCPGVDVTLKADGSLSNSVIDTIYNNIVQSEINRIRYFQSEAGKQLAENTPGIKDGHGIFYYFPTLNDDKFELFENGILKDIDNNPKLQDIIRNEIKIVLRKEIWKLIKDWEKYGILNNTYEKGIITESTLVFSDKDYINSVVDPNISNTALQNQEGVYAAADYYINYLIVNMNILQTITKSDIVTFYKKGTNTLDSVERTISNFNKRSKSFISPGSITIHVEKDEAPEFSGNFLLVHAIDRKGKLSKALPYLKALLQDEATPYNETTATDAQMIGTLKASIASAVNGAKLNDTEFKLAKQFLKGKIDFTNVDHLKLIVKLLQPEKPVHVEALKQLATDSTGKEFIAHFNFTFVKCSTNFLIDGVTNNLSLDTLRKEMEELEQNKGKYKGFNPNKYPVRLAFSSAIKSGGTVTPVEIFDAEGNIKEDLDLTKGIVSTNGMNVKNFKIQDTLPIHDAESIGALTQPRKQIWVNFENVPGFMYRGKEYLGGALRKKFEDTYGELFKWHMDNLIEEFAIETIVNKNGTTQVKLDYDKLAEVLIDEAKNRNLNINAILGLELNEKDGIKSFAQKLYLNAGSIQYERLLCSIIDNRIRKLHHTGTSSVLGTQEGYITDPNLIKKFIEETPGIIFTSKWSGELLPGGMYTKEGKLVTKEEELTREGNYMRPHQVITSCKLTSATGEFINLLEKDENDKYIFVKEINGKLFIDETKIPLDILEGLGMRVPNQAPNSSAWFEIVGFLPAGVDLIIAPRDFVTQMGSDFDVDKLYSYLYHTTFDKHNTFSKTTISTEVTAEERYNKFIRRTAGDKVNEVYDQTRIKLDEAYALKAQIWKEAEEELNTFYNRYSVTKEDIKSIRKDKKEARKAIGKLMDELDSLQEKLDFYNDYKETAEDWYEKLPKHLRDNYTFGFEGQDLTYKQILDQIKPLVVELKKKRKKLNDAIAYLDTVFAFEDELEEIIKTREEGNEEYQIEGFKQVKERIKQIKADRDAALNEIYKPIKEATPFEVFKEWHISKQISAKTFKGTKDNELLDMELSIFKNTNPIVQKAITTPLNSNDYGKVVEILLSYKKRDAVTYVLSPRYMEDQYNSSRSGSVARGVYSILTSGISSFQGIGGLHFTGTGRLYAGIRDTLIYLNGEGEEICKVNFGHRVSSDLNVITTNDGSGRYKSDISSSVMGAAFDEGTLKYLTDSNNNTHTFDAICYLICAGYNLDLFMLINQQSIIDYANEVERLTNITEDYTADINSVAAATVLNKYGFSQDNVLLKYWEIPLTKKELYEGKPAGDFSLEAYLEKGEKLEDFKLVQQVALIKFLLCSSMGGVVKEVLSTINTDARGVPKNILEVSSKITKVAELINVPITNITNVVGEYIGEEHYGRLSDTAKKQYYGIALNDGNIVYIKPNTIHGYASIYALNTANILYNELYPYQFNSIKAIFNEVNTVTNKKLEEQSSRSIADFNRKTFDAIRSMIYTKEGTGLFPGTIDDIRKQLLYDEWNESGEQTHYSLASIIDIVKTNNTNSKFIAANSFIQSIHSSNNNFEGINKDGSPSTIRYKAAPGESRFETNHYAQFVSLFTLKAPNGKSPIIGDFNGKPYTLFDLGTDLVRYAMITSGTQYAIQYHRFIPIEFLKQIGFTEKINNFAIDKFDSFNIQSFNRNTYWNVNSVTEQIVQHNPGLVPRVVMKDVSYNGTVDKMKYFTLTSSSEPNYYCTRFFRKPNGEIAACVGLPEFLALPITAKNRRDYNYHSRKKFNLYKLYVTKLNPKDNEILEYQYIQIDTLGSFEATEYDINHKNNEDVQINPKASLVYYHQSGITPADRAKILNMEHIPIEDVTITNVIERSKQLGNIIRGTMAANLISDMVLTGEATTTIRTESYHKKFYNGDGIYRMSNNGKLVNISYLGVAKKIGNKIKVRLGKTTLELTLDQFAAKEGFGTWDGFLKGSKYSDEFIAEKETRHMYTIIPYDANAQPVEKERRVVVKSKPLAKAKDQSNVEIKQTTNPLVTLAGGFSSEGRGTKEGDGKDKAMREVADGIIYEVDITSKFEYSSTWTSQIVIGKKWDGKGESGHFGHLNETPKVVMLARNGELQGKPLEDITKTKILESKNKGAKFVVGDMPGVDSPFIDYLTEIGASFTIYHAGKSLRVPIPTVSKKVTPPVKSKLNKTTKPKTGSEAIKKTPKAKVKVTTDTTKAISTVFGIKNSSAGMTNASKALSYIQSNSQNEGHILLAELLSTNLPNLHTVNKLEIDNTLAARGAYLSNVDVISINPDKHNTLEELEYTLLHELTHAFTLQKINAAINNPSALNEKELHAAKELLSLYEHTLSLLSPKERKRITEIKEGLANRTLVLNPNERETIYPYSNINEFIAAALTSKTFQEKLNGIDYSTEETLWDKLIDILVRLLSATLGVENINKNSILLPVLQNIYTLINENEGRLSKDEVRLGERVFSIKSVVPVKELIEFFREGDYFTNTHGSLASLLSMNLPNEPNVHFTRSVERDRMGLAVGNRYISLSIAALRYNNMTRKINNGILLLHETLHLFNNDFLVENVNTPIVNNIQELYNIAKQNIEVNGYPTTVPKERVDNAFKNLNEFLSIGLTDDKLAGWLHSIDIKKYQTRKTSVYFQLFRAQLDILKTINAETTNEELKEFNDDYEKMLTSVEEKLNPLSFSIKDSLGRKPKFDPKVTTALITKLHQEYNKDIRYYNTGLQDIIHYLNKKYGDGFASVGVRKDVFKRTTYVVKFDERNLEQIPEEDNNVVLNPDEVIDETMTIPMEDDIISKTDKLKHLINTRIDFLKNANDKLYSRLSYERTPEDIMGIRKEIESNKILIDNLVNYIEDQIPEFSSLDHVRAFANFDIDTVDRIICKSELTNNDISIMNTILKTWTHSMEYFMDETDKQSAIAVAYINDIYGRVNNLNNLFQEKVTEYLNVLLKKYSDDGDIDIKTIMNGVVDASKGYAIMYDITRFDNPLLQEVGKAVKRVKFAGKLELDKRLEEFNTISIAAQSALANLPGRPGWQVFAQEYDDGNHTGDLVHKFTVEYFMERGNGTRNRSDNSTDIQSEWSSRNELAIDFRKLFYDDARIKDWYWQRDAEGNEIIFNEADRNAHIKELKKHLGEKGYNRVKEQATKLLEQFELELEAAKLAIESDVTVESGTEEQAVNLWIRNNSPFWANGFRYAHVNLSTGNLATLSASNVAKEHSFRAYTYNHYRNTILVPLRYYEDGSETGWYDKKFETIEQSDALLKFYDYVLNTIGECRPYLSAETKRHTRTTTIPTIVKELTDNFIKRGLTNAINLDSIKMMLRANEDGAIKYETVDPFTGERERKFNESFLRNNHKLVRDKVQAKILSYVAKHGNNPSPDTIETFKHEATNEVVDAKSFNLDVVMRVYLTYMIELKHLSRIEDLVKYAFNYLQQLEEPILKPDGSIMFELSGVQATKKNADAYRNTKVYLEHWLDFFYDVPQKLDKGLGTSAKWLTKEEKKYKVELEVLRGEIEKSYTNKVITLEEYEKSIAEIDNQLKELGGHIHGTKVGNALISFIRLKALGWKPFTAFNNMLFGFICGTMEASDGRVIKYNHWWKAYRMCLNSLGKGLTLNTVSTPTAKKIRALADRLDILYTIRDEYKRRHNDATHNKRTDMLKGYYMIERSEYMNSAPLMVALMLGTNVVSTVDNKTYNLYEAFDNDGNWNVAKMGKNEAWEGNLTALVKKTEDGKETKEETIVGFRVKLMQLIGKTNGDYNPDSYMDVKRDLLGRGIAMFRTWIPEAFANAFESPKFDKILGIERKGRYNTLYNLKQGYFKRMSKDKGVAIGTLNGLFDIAFNLLKKVSFGKVKTNFDRLVDDKTFTATDAANMRKVCSEIMLYMGLIGVAMLLKAAFDDDDDKDGKGKYFVNYALNVMTRIQTDMEFWVSPASMESITQNTIPILTLLKDTQQLIGAMGGFVIGEDKIDGGAYDGNSKLWRETCQFMPFTSAAYSTYTGATSLIKRRLY